MCHHALDYVVIYTPMSLQVFASFPFWEGWTIQIVLEHIHKHNVSNTHSTKQWLDKVNGLKDPLHKIIMQLFALH